MKLSKDTGRKENLAGLVVWILFIVIYYCAISLFLRGSVISDIMGQPYSILENLGTIGIIVVSVTAGLLTARPLFRIFLRLKAYRPQKGAGWKEWRGRKEKTAERKEGGS